MIAQKMFKQQLQEEMYLPEWVKPIILEQAKTWLTCEQKKYEIALDIKGYEVIGKLLAELE